MASSICLRKLCLVMVLLLALGTINTVTAGEPPRTSNNTGVQLALLGVKHCILEHWPLSNKTGLQKNRVDQFQDIKNYTDKKANYYHQSHLDEVTMKKNLNRTKLALARSVASNVSLRATGQTFECMINEFVLQFDQASNDIGLKRNITQAYYLAKSVLLYTLDKHLSRQVGNPVDFFPVYNSSTNYNVTAANVTSSTGSTSTAPDPFMTLFIIDANLAQSYATSAATDTSTNSDYDALIRFSSADSIPLIPATDSAELITTELIQLVL